MLKRLVPRLRTQWPGVAIEVRADSGFASPALYAYCEAEGPGYTIGPIPNPRLAGEAQYQAGGWDRERRVIDKADALLQGPNTRFVVTSRADAPLALYDWYVGRGDAENRSKDFKRACWADRLSRHRFLANQLRLLLHAAAYWLLDTLRRWLA